MRWSGFFFVQVTNVFIIIDLAISFFVVRPEICGNANAKMWLIVCTQAIGMKHKSFIISVYNSQKHFAIWKF